MLDNADVLSDLDQLRSRYQVLRHLGDDGGCAVYAVRGRGADEHYLVKVMRKPGSGSVQAGTLHLWQAHTMLRLDHPKLIVLHTVNHLQGGTLALAMERRRGQTLAERIETGGPLSLGEVESTLRDLGEALTYLHGRGVVHRGVKPDSVLLDRDSECARLAHFGIPGGGREGQAASDEGASLRRTVAYEAPEQARERTGRPADLDSRTDLYSLGLVGYAMLTGRDMWAGESGAGSLPASLPPLETLRSDSPPYLCRAIEGCLERDPRRRWRSAEEFISRLDPCAEEITPAPRAELWMGGGRGLTAVRSALAGPWGAVHGRKVALGVPAVLVAGLAWVMLRPADAPAPPSAEPQRVAGAVASDTPWTQHLAVEPPIAANETTGPITSEIADVPIGAAPANVPDLERRPVAKSASSAAASPAANRRRSGRSVDARSAQGSGPVPRTTATRRPPVPLLGEELASADQER